GLFFSSRRRHTRFSRDWSSDVCSSDLVTEWLNPVEGRAWRAVVAVLNRLPGALDTDLQRESGVTHFEYWVLTLLSEAPDRRLQIDRKSVAQGKSAGVARGPAT